MIEHQRACSLRHGLDQQHAWDDRRAGKMAQEEGLVDGDVFDRRSPLSSPSMSIIRSMSRNGIAMRQQLQDAGYVR